MGKTGLKTFVCSFVLSLFTILTVNKEFFHTPNTPEPEIIIPNKNISLFFKALPAPVSAQTIPVKKIALSLPAAPQQVPAESLQGGETIPLTFAAQETISQQNNEKALPQPQAPVLYQPQDPPLLAEKIDIPLHKPEIAVLPPNPNNEFIKTAQKEPPTEDEFAQKSLDDTAPKIIQARVEIKKIDNRKKKTATTKDEAVPVVLKNEETTAPRDDNKRHSPQKQEQVLAANEPTDLLIPLQKDINASVPNGEINIIKTPERNQLAMADSKETIRGMIAKSTASSDNESKKATDDQWETMAAKNNGPSTWVVAKGAVKHPKNSQVLKEKYYTNNDIPVIKKALTEEPLSTTSNKKEIQLAASKMVDNLLIPIPEDILNDENLTPQLVSSTEDKSIEEKIIQEELDQKGTITTDKQTKPFKKSVEESKKSGLLTSIKSIFSSNDANKPADSMSEAAEDDEEPGFFDQIAGKVRKSTASNKILPTEIRLSFQPNRAEISGPTLRWIQAFANKTIEDAAVGLEIRIDGTSSFELQQKRLNLLHNILTNSGVDYRKINTVFTSREANSFIIRTIRITNNNGNGSIKKNEQWQNSYYQQW